MMTLALIKTLVDSTNCTVFTFSLQDTFTSLSSTPPSSTSTFLSSPDMLVTAETLAYLQLGLFAGQLLSVVLCVAILSSLRKWLAKSSRREPRRPRPSAPSTTTSVWYSDLEEGGPPPTYSSVCRPMSPYVARPRPVSVHGTVSRGANSNIYQTVP